MAYSKASQKAVDKYIKNNYDSYTIRFKRGDKEKIKARAESLNMSLNAYIVALIEKDMENAHLE